MRKYCLSLDLKDDPELIEEYDNYHKSVWPEVVESIHKAGVIRMEIYRVQTRLFMIMETTSSFSFQKKEELDALNEKVQDWESLMWKYQERLPWANPGEKWVLMKRIFSLKEQTKNSTDSGIARLGHY